jgi:hypothetical protein
MMLNPVRQTQATTAAIEQAIQVLRKALGTGSMARERVVSRSIA